MSANLTLRVVDDLNGEVFGDQARTGIATGGSPSDVTGLVLWIKADSESYSNNDDVGTLTDRSGQGNNGTATGTDRAIFKTNQVNGLPAYYWDGGQHFFTFPDFASGLGAAEIFLVIYKSSDGAGPYGFWDFSATDLASAITYTDNHIYDGWGSTVRKDVGDPTPTLIAWRLYNVHSAASDWEFLLDGTSLFSTATNTVTFRTAPIFGKSSDAEAFGGYLAEMIMYNKVLNTTERSTVKSYIAAKYALSIS